MPVVRKEKTNVPSKSSKSFEEPCTRPSVHRRETNESSGGLNNHRQSGDRKTPYSTVQPRRSARLASTYKYTVPADKPIVPNRCLLERKGPKRSFDAYKPVHPDDLSKQPAWPTFDTTRRLGGSGSGHGNRKLRREYSFVLVDCGSHFEMVSPKAVGHFSRVPRCFGTMAPYHNFGSDVGEEELRKGLCAELVRGDEEEEEGEAAAAAASAARETVGTGQTRKRGRQLEDDGEEEGDSTANDDRRPMKRARVTKAKSMVI